jgi:LysM repeat protein
LKPASVIHPGQKLKVPGTNAVASAPAVAPTAAAIAPVQNTPGKTHTVRQGETYFSIAKKHGVSTSSLIAANPAVKASALRPGQVIRLGGSGSSTAMISAPVSQAKATPAAVKSPETKSPALASQSMPVSHTKTTEPKPAEAPVPAPAPAVERESASFTPENKFRPITIDGEMTYGEFAAKHGTDAERLNALNGLDLTTATVLAKGSELYVPAQP